MKLVSDQSEAEIKRNNAEKKLRHALRQIVASLDAGHEGAGKPLELGNDVIRCAGCIR